MMELIEVYTELIKKIETYIINKDLEKRKNLLELYKMNVFLEDKSIELLKHKLELYKSKQEVLEELIDITANEEKESYKKDFIDIKETIKKKKEEIKKHEKIRKEEKTNVRVAKKCIKEDKKDFIEKGIDIWFKN